MTSRCSALALWAFLPLVLAGPAAGGIQPFQLGDYNRHRTSVFDATGGVVVAWEEADGIAVRRFDAQGNPRDEEGVVTSGARSTPSLAPLAGGGFAVAGLGADGNGTGLFLRLFDEDGQPLGPERRVSAPVGGDQIGAIHPLPQGGFLAAWTSPAPQGGRRLLVRRFGATGGKIGAALVIRAFAAGETFHQVTPGPGASFLVTWAVKPRKPCGHRAQRYDLAGRPLGKVFDLCTLALTLDDSLPPLIAAQPGGYVTAWGNDFGMYVRRYSVTGEPRGATTRIDTSQDPAGWTSKSHPAVASAPSGAFLVAWEGFPCATECEADSGSIDVAGFSAEGRRQDIEGSYWDSTAGCRPGQIEPQVAAGPEGRFVLTWLWGCGSGDDYESAAWGSILSLVPPPAGTVLAGTRRTRAGSGGSGSPALPFYVLEAWEDAGGIQVPVERQGGSQGALSVRFQSFNPDVRWGYAEPGLDFLNVSGVLSWGDGDAATKYFVVPLLDDTEVEDLEGFTVFVRAPGAGSFNQNAWISILDDELRLTPGSLDFVGPREIEVEEGAGAVELAVRRTGGMGGRVSVRYRIEAGTAQAGSDFRGTTGVLLWGDSDLAPRVIRVPIRNDRVAEPEEYFRVELFAPTGGVHLPDGSAVSVDIRDDDARSEGAAEM